MKSAALLAFALLAVSSTRAQDTHGVATSSIDHSVKPGDNFSLYANGDWIKRTELPAWRRKNASAYGNDAILRESLKAV
jgi:putative endopeptidase